MKGTILTFVLAAIFTQAGAQTISGKVTDNQNQPLIGVVVMAEGTQKGDVTNIDGNYTIQGLQQGKYKVRFQFTGLKTEYKTVELGAAPVVINMTLKEDPKQLDEVVVVGYGVQRRRELTSSIAKISTKELTDLPVQSFEQAMQGKLAGVAVTQGSGVAGSPSIIRIRGISSISASGDPLYVIDGIPITQSYAVYGNSGGFNFNPLATINPNDIESVEVLKDAAATAIYGSRGANGVIMITTRRAKKGKLAITYNGQLGFSTPTARPKLVSRDEFLQLYEEAWINDGRVGKPDLSVGGITGITWDEARNNNTDWYSATTQTGVRHQHDITLSKGWDKFNVFSSISYLKNETFIRGNSYERISTRFNMDYQILKNLKASFGTSFTSGLNNRIYSGWSGGFGLVMSSALPIYPIRNADGTYFTFNNSDAAFRTNPVMMQDLYKWETRELRSINSISLDYQVIKNLSVRAQGNYDYQNIADDNFSPAELLRATRADTTGIARRDANHTNNYNYTIQATYNYDINRFNNISVTGGFERQRSVTNGVSLQQRNATGLLQSNEPTSVPYFTSSGTPNPNFLSTNKLQQEWIFERYFSRFNYSLWQRYYAQVSLSYDGSSRFGTNYRYGFFPAVSAGWNISDESFLSGNKTISYLKLRSSYGKAGNSDFENDARFGFFQLSPGTPYNGQPILYPTKLENRNLRWETSWTFNVGLDFGLFNDRITGTVEYYDKRSSDIIMRLNIDPSNGFSEYFDNVGSIRNHGIELSLKSNNIVGRNFKWTTQFVIARNLNELTSTGNYTEEAVSGGTNDTRIVVGSPVGTFYLVRFSHVDKETGRPVYLDKNGNETFTWDPSNRVPVGSILPKATGGLTNTFQYKNWDLSILFIFQIGGSIYDASAKRQLGVVSFWNIRPEIADRWQKPGDDAKFPRLTLDASNYGLPNYWQYNTTMWMYDASFVRLRNLSIGYNLPAKWAKKAGMGSARIGFIGTNLLVFTSYPGLDPEIARDGEGNINQSRNMQAQNTYYLNAPQERTYNFQVTLTF
jgi:TonB-linked SusC/RagA family outer membrane protein